MPRARKPAAPPLPRLTLVNVPVQVRAPMKPSLRTEHDVVAQLNGEPIRRWPWWSADKPRNSRAAYMVLDGVRYQIEFAA